MRFIILVILSILIFSCSNSRNNESKEVEPVLAMLKANCQDGVRKLNDMAEAGNSCAQYNLGVVYLGDVLRLDCVKPNKDLAIKWLEASAKKKNGDAYTMLGAIYEGDGFVPKDLNKAFHFYELGMKSQNKIAIHKLGMMCLRGEGCNKDVSRAISLFKTASDSGHYESSMMFGSIYSSGTLADKNYGIALQYLKRAAQNGPEEAKVAYHTVLFEKLKEDVQSKTFSSDEYSEIGDQFYELMKFAYDRKAYNDARICYNGAVNSYRSACYGVDGMDTSKNYDYPACKKFIELKSVDPLRGVERW